MSAISLSAGLELDVFSAHFRRDRVTCGDTVFDVQIGGFANVLHHLIMGVALGYAAGQCRRDGDISPVVFLFENDRIEHGVWPFDFDHTNERIVRA